MLISLTGRRRGCIQGIKVGCDSRQLDYWIYASMEILWDSGGRYGKRTCRGRDSGRHRVCSAGVQPERVREVHIGAGGGIKWYIWLRNMWFTHDDDHEARRRRHGRMGIEQRWLVCLRACHLSSISLRWRGCPGVVVPGEWTLGERSVVWQCGDPKVESVL